MQHGYCIPSIEGYKIVDVLGQGSCSTVYKVCANNNDFVAKVYHRGVEAKVDMQHEQDVLSALSAVPNVPRLVVTSFGSETLPVLILTPVALPLRLPDYSDRSLTSSDINGMIDVLESAHNVGIIHRDVRLPNLYLRGYGVLVNDWGCACIKVIIVCCVLYLCNLGCHFTVACMSVAGKHRQ
jgi:serine/threonine protein kinase